MNCVSVGVQYESSRALPRENSEIDTSDYDDYALMTRPPSTKTSSRLLFFRRQNHALDGMSFACPVRSAAAGRCQRKVQSSPIRSNSSRSRTQPTQRKGSWGRGAKDMRLVIDGKPMSFASNYRYNRVRPADRGTRCTSSRSRSIWTRMAYELASG